MADLGDTSTAGTAHKHKTTSWVTVLVLIAASIIIGVAFVVQSVPLGIAGVVVGVIGTVMAIVFKLMDDAH